MGEGSEPECGIRAALDTQMVELADALDSGVKRLKENPLCLGDF